LFFLTDVDVPWEKDDLRDKPENREATLAVFEKALIDYNKPYIKLSGSVAERFEKALKIINDLVKAKKLGLNSYDFVQIYNRNINLETIDFQFNIIKNGIPKINLDRAAVLNDGIIPVSQDEAKYYSNFLMKRKTS